MANYTPQQEDSSHSMSGIDVLTGSGVAKIFRTLVEVRNIPATIDAIKVAVASCIKWGDSLQKIMKPGSIAVLFVRQYDVAPSPELFSRISRELTAGNCIMVGVKLPESSNHIFTIEGIGNGKAHILHSWQNREGLRIEQAMCIDKLVPDLQRLLLLDYATDRAEIEKIRGRLWGSDHAAIPDIGTSSRRNISLEMSIKGMPNFSLRSGNDLITLESLHSDLSHWESSRSSDSGVSEWHSASCSCSSGGEPLDGHIMQFHGGVEAGLGFVFGAGEVYGVTNGNEIVNTEEDPEILKSGLGGGASDVAVTGVAEVVTPTVVRVGTPVVRSSVVAGVAMLGVFEIWDVTEWKMHRITDVALRKGLAVESGLVAGAFLGVAGGVGAGGIILGPIGAVVGGFCGGIYGAIAGSLMAMKIGIWDESEDSVMKSYKFFGWRHVKQKTRPVKNAEEMARAYDRKRGEKPKKIEKEDWDKVCLATLMVHVAAMYPEFKEMMQLSKNLKENKSDALSAIATAFYKTLQKE